MRALLLSLAACGSSAVTPGRPADNAVEATPVAPSEPEAAASAEFQGQVRASARAIKGCYNSAQSANPELRTREIDLAIVADFEPSGLVALSLRPMVTESFAECVKQRTAGWKVAVPSRMTLRASLKLTP